MSVCISVYVRVCMYELSEYACVCWYVCMCPGTCHSEHVEDSAHLQQSIFSFPDGILGSKSSWAFVSNTFLFFLTKLIFH